MGGRTLEQAFNALFHNRERFADFCSLDLSQHIDEVTIKGRTVYRTSERLRNYLRFIDKVALRHLATNALVAHAYIKEKSVLTAVSAHAGNSDFFLSDIKSFFSRITEEDVRRILLRDTACIPLKDFDAHIPYFATIMTWGGSIPVGFPTSPRLSNAFLLEFDTALSDFCTSRELTCTRYSDDIIISGKNKRMLVDLRDRVQEMLHSYASNDLFLNSEKTCITHVGNKVKVLGLVITHDGRVTVDSKYKKILESLLHFYVADRVRYDDLLKRTFEGKQHSLFGMLHYVRATDPAYLEKLQRKYGLLVLRTLMEDKWHGNR